MFSRVRGYGRYNDMRGCNDRPSGGCIARVVEPLSRDELTSAGTFMVDASVAFPLQLSVSAISVDVRPAGSRASSAPSVFFTLYSPTGAAASEDDGTGTTSSIRGLVWLPIWLALFSFLRYPMQMDTSHGMCTVLFVSMMVCATGYQVQLWISGAW